jgi:hypothetical protein
MLQHIVTDYCRERNLESGSRDAQEAASELLKWFQAGVTESVKLREMLYSRP